MGEKERKTADTCQGVSVWDEPCTRPATRCCKECGRWFCDTHFADADSRSMLGPLDRLKRMLDAGVAQALPLAIVGLCQWHRHAYRRVDQSR